jgi:cellulose synthase/poly-beta-1,6-N-acetylglucosamine synthase-like glycosyltransferase
MGVLLQIIKCLFYAFSCIIAFYFLLPIALHLLYYIVESVKINRLNKNNIKTDHNFDFAAIITVHQDTRFIAPFVDSFLKQQYDNFKVYIVADDCDISNLLFSDDRIVIIKPESALNSKIKSIQYAINHFKQKHDVIIIFDSDNLIHPNYLKNLNKYFQRGFRVVQTHMLSKNIDNRFARLDSIGHIYYTFYERKVKMKLGISSAILGLGIALDYDLYKEINYENVVGGFDKKLQAQLARKVTQIAFAEDAIVYDEKVEDGAVLKKQRTRWIYSYFNHFKESWLLILTGFKNLNSGQILLGATMLRPPMVLQLLSLIFIVIITLIINPVLLYGWAILVFLFAMNFILTIATQSRQKGMLHSIKHIPLLIFSQLRALINIKSAKQSFLKTEHEKIIYIDELLKNEIS